MYVDPIVTFVLRFKVRNHAAGQTAPSHAHNEMESVNNPAGKQNKHSPLAWYFLGFRGSV
jgi:hypothetical protein